MRVRKRWVRYTPAKRLVINGAAAAGVAVILVGLLFRSVVTYLFLIGEPFIWKERLFCVVAYIPKAPVQAAIGSIPLASGIAAGEVILAVAGLSILLTAPAGAIAITSLGERILDNDKRSGYGFKHLRERMGLPRVGERVLNKDSGDVWKSHRGKRIMARWRFPACEGTKVQWLDTCERGEVLEGR